jgi:alpha-N-arabinofuranosidase
MNFKKIMLTATYLLGIYFASAQSFRNPILSGFYPDPSICRAGDDYYLINSSFSYFPGIPIFHSKDLVNWQQIGHALDRPEQLDMQGPGTGVSRGLFAPAITYHNGVFYIVCTRVDKGGNFVITAKDPKGPWSNPVYLPEVNGIDPSLFFDDQKAYIIYNSIPPENKTLYDGHRTIRINEFDPVALKVVSDNKILINGGTNIYQKPVWIEGPHIYKKNDWYYLMCAQGGTGYNHTEVVFRSKSMDDMFMPYEGNPILTQMHLDRQRPYPITTTGHADLVDDAKGNWWGVFLGCRPYVGNYYNTGRETFMAPVKWVNEWPIFDLGGEVLKYEYPIDAKVDPSMPKYNGNFTFTDPFDDDKLSFRYSFLRTIKEPWYNLANGKLTMQLRPETCSELANPSFIGFRQSHIKGSAAVSFNFAANQPHEQAGLLVFQSEYHYYFLCQSVENGKPVVQLYKGAGENAQNKEPGLLASIPMQLKKGQALMFKAEAKGATYDFFYAIKANQWIPVKQNVDATFLSTETAGGFVGCYYAMYATSNGKPSTQSITYDWFEYKGDDDVYKQ